MIRQERGLGELRWDATADLRGKHRGDEGAVAEEHAPGPSHWYRAERGEDAGVAIDGHAPPSDRIKNMSNANFLRGDGEPQAKVVGQGRPLELIKTVDQIQSPSMKISIGNVGCGGSFIEKRIRKIKEPKRTWGRQVGLGGISA